MPSKPKQLKVSDLSKVLISNNSQWEICSFLVSFLSQMRYSSGDSDHTKEWSTFWKTSLYTRFHMAFVNLAAGILNYHWDEFCCDGVSAKHQFLNRFSFHLVISYGTFIILLMYSNSINLNLTPVYHYLTFIEYYKYPSGFFNDRVLASGWGRLIRYIFVQYHIVYLAALLNPN